MAIQTANREAERQEGLRLDLISTNVHFYRGALVSILAGVVVKAGDTAASKLAGVVAGEVDNTSLASGAATTRVEVERDGIFSFVYGPGNATIAKVGATVFVVDDQTVTDAATTNNIVAGQIVEVVSATKVRVDIKVGL